MLNGTITYRMFLDGYSLLFKKDFVRRISKNRYMFNPEFFVIVGEAQLYFDLKWQEAPLLTYSDIPIRVSRCGLCLTIGSPLVLQSELCGV